MKIVRDGQKVWPFCAECGCRMQIIPDIHLADKLVDVTHWFGDIIYEKNGVLFKTDARGHRCSRLFYSFRVESKKLSHII